jgi:hypothetical protein
MLTGTGWHYSGRVCQWEARGCVILGVLDELVWIGQWESSGEVAFLAWSTLAYRWAVGGDLSLLGYFGPSLTATLRKAYPPAGEIAPMRPRLEA